MRSVNPAIEMMHTPGRPRSFDDEIARPPPIEMATCPYGAFLPVRFQNTGTPGGALKSRWILPAAADA